MVHSTIDVIALCTSVADSAVIRRRVVTTQGRGVTGQILVLYFLPDAPQGPKTDAGWKFYEWIEQSRSDPDWRARKDTWACRTF